MGSEPKSKDTDKIKFFKIDNEGDIAPAFPKDKPQGEGTGISRIEPVFGSNPTPEGEAPPDAGAPPPESSELPPMDGFGMLPEFGSDAGAAPPPTIDSDPAPMNGLSNLEDRIASALAPEEGTHTGIGPVKVEPGSQPQLEVQADLLKPQIESIARLPKGDSLSNEQADVLRKYISVKEAEVRDLRDQQRQYQGVVKKLSQQLEQATKRGRDNVEGVEGYKRENEQLKRELARIHDKHQGELAMQKNDYDERMRRSGNYDAQADEFYKKREEWKEKVKEELKRIKLKERELENKHELLRRDMQALLDAKDKHLLELKKKSDALELEQETLEDRLRKANVVIAAIDSRKRRLIETMRLAISLLESIDSVEGINDEDSRKAG